VQAHACSRLIPSRPGRSVILLGHVLHQCRHRLALGGDTTRWTYLAGASGCAAPVIVSSELVQKRWLRGMRRRQTPSCLSSCRCSLPTLRAGHEGTGLHPPVGPTCLTVPRGEHRVIALGIKNGRLQHQRPGYGRRPGTPKLSAAPGGPRIFLSISLSGTRQTLCPGPGFAWHD